MQHTILYYSYSGVTRGVAEALGKDLNGKVIEVKPKVEYSKIKAYTIGCKRAVKEECDPITPDTFDLSDTDVLVIGTPVWAWKAAPPVNSIIEGLKNAEGKKAVLFATCRSSGKDILQILAAKLEAKGVTVTAKIILTEKECLDKSKVDSIASAVRVAGTLTI